MTNDAHCVETNKVETNKVETNKDYKELVRHKVYTNGKCRPSCPLSKTASVIRRITNSTDKHLSVQFGPAPEVW